MFVDTPFDKGPVPVPAPLSVALVAAAEADNVGLSASILGATAIAARAMDNFLKERNAVIRKRNIHN